MQPGARFERRAVESLAGRRAELEYLEGFALGDETVVLHIHGIPGVGKTHLLNALAARIRGTGALVIWIDAGWCEPSPAGFCRAVCKAIRVSESDDPAFAAASLSNAAGRILVVLDNYDLSGCSTRG